MRKLFLICVVAALCFGQTPDCDAARSRRDHLVPVKKALGSRAAYEELWQKKLLVTPGEIARFVGLPGSIGVETAISVYQAPGREGSLPGDYWVTATQASERLWNCIEPGAKNPVDPNAIAVQRCDAPIPEAAAQATHKTWLTMLSQSRPHRNSREIPVDSSREIFSAVDLEGRLLQGESSTNPEENTKALINIALSLLQYCGAETPESATIVTDIEKAASDLLDRVASNSGNRAQLRNAGKARYRKQTSAGSRRLASSLALISNATEPLPADNTAIVQILSDGPAPLQRKIADLPGCVMRGLRRWYEKPFALIEQGQDFPKLRDIRRAGDGQFRLLFFSELKDGNSVLCFEDYTSFGRTRRAVIFRRSGSECTVVADFAFDLPLDSLEDLRTAINTQSSGK